jgi:hypothetical protein
MNTLTITRSDVTVEEISEALRHGPGPRYAVLPGTAMNWNPIGRPRPDHADMITVATTPTRLFRAELKVSQQPGRTIVHVIAGGIGPLPRLVNRFWIAAKVRRVLQTTLGCAESPSLVDPDPH